VVEIPNGTKTFEEQIFKASGEKIKQIDPKKRMNLISPKTKDVSKEREKQLLRVINNPNVSNINRELARRNLRRLKGGS